MFNNAGNCASVPLVTTLNGGNGNGGGYGNGMWGENGLLFIIVLALLFGWGRNGFGGNGGDGGTGTSTQFIPYAFSSANTDAEIQRGFNQQAVITKLDGITQGICSLGYDQLSQMNGINQNISQTGFGIQQAINADTVSNMQNTFGLQSTLANMSAQNQQCCCNLERGQDSINYNLATQACATNTQIANSTRDIVESQNCGTRAILDALTQQRIEAKDAKIDELQSLVNSLNLAQSQSNQNTYLVNQLRPSPIPAFPVANPYMGYGIGYGCNSGCGCA